MKKFLTILILAMSTTVVGQNVAISGALYNADTVEITITHLGEMVSRHRTAASVYTIFLGAEDFYTVSFKTRGKDIKYLHFFCYNLSDPTTIKQDVHFSNKTNLILWKWRGESGRKSKLEEHRTIWGAQAQWKDEF